MFAVLLSFACLPAAVAEETATRVALVSAGGGETGKDLLALAEARLGGAAAIVLLDRQEVSRVLQEQKLAVSGLGGSEQALAVGMLLRVEVFAVLETVPGEKQPLGLVVFDAATGVRLQDAAFSTRDAEQTARAIAGTIQSACAKRRHRADGLRTIGLLSVRNADLPRSMDARCQAVAAMLERSLTRCDDFAVLERKRLEHVNKERTLPADSPAGRLMASLLMIELEIGRGTDGKGLRAVALVHDAAGKRLAEARAAVPGEDIASLASALLKDLCKALRAVHAPLAGNPAAEARLFFHEAWLWEQYDEQVGGLAVFQQYDNLAGALAAAESAYALQPGSRLYAVSLARAIVAYARRLLNCDRRGLSRESEQAFRDRKPGELREAFELALRALDLRMEDARQHESRLGFDDGGWYSVDSGLRAICRVSAEMLPHCPAEVRPALQEFRGQFHRHFIAACMKWAGEAVQDREAIGRFLESWSDFDRTLMFAAADSDQYVSDLCNVIGRWLESWRQCGNVSFAFNDDHLNETPLCFFILHDRPPHYRIGPRDYARLRPLLATMRKHPVPLVQEYGIWGQIWVAQRCGGPCPSFADLKAVNRKHIEQPGVNPADPMRGLYWLYQYSNWRACAGGGCFFVSAPDGGIHAFLLDGGKPFYIDEAAGLPCNAVQAMAWFEGKLYVTLGDSGYFVCYDVHRRRCEILASGRTKNGQLPFNDASPFGISYLAGDPQRHRLLLGLGFAGHLGYDDRWKYNGLWQYDPASGSFRQILKVSPADGSSVDRDTILLYGDTWLLRVDLKTDKADVRLASPKNGIGPGLDPTTAPYQNPVWNMPPMAELDGWLWTVRPTFFRRSKDAGKVEWLPWVETGKSVASYEYLQAVGDGSELVVGNDSGFWLLTLKDKPQPAPPATQKAAAK